MATPYRVPAAPNPTPLVASVSARLGGRTRPPIQNPFDKFNQNEFESWVGGITTAIRKALGQEEEEEKPTEPQVTEDTTRERQPFALSDVDMDAEQGDESLFEDSFADFKARRSAKGKGRDPREGPGLPVEGWNKDQPIEILSDEEDEDEQAHEDIFPDGSWESEDEEVEQGEEEYDEEEYEEADDVQGPTGHFHHESEGSPSPHEEDSPNAPSSPQTYGSPQPDEAKYQEVYELDDEEDEYEEEPRSSPQVFNVDSDEEDQEEGVQGENEGAPKQRDSLSPRSDISMGDSDVEDFQEDSRSSPAVVDQEDEDFDEINSSASDSGSLQYLPDDEVDEVQPMAEDTCKSP